MTSEESLQQAVDLLDRLEASRARLETLMEESPDPDEVVEVLQEFNEIAKAAQAALERARQEAT